MGLTFNVKYKTIIVQNSVTYLFGNFENSFISKYKKKRVFQNVRSLIQKREIWKKKNLNNNQICMCIIHVMIYF